MGGSYSDDLKDDLPQDEGDEPKPIIFRKHLKNITGKTGKYSGYQLFHVIYRDNYPTPA